MTPWLDDGDVRLYHGDNLDVLRQLPDRSVHMCATSPPFYGLRDYGTGEWEGGDPDCDHLGKPHATQAGFNERYFGKPSGTDKQGELREPFKNVCGKCGARRVDQQIGLEDTPDLWVERLVAVFREVRRVLRDDGTLWVEIGDSYSAGGLGPGQDGAKQGTNAGSLLPTAKKAPPGYKPKDLLGQPWLLAFALRADGWYLRSEIIWARPNPMPESVTDRPTKSHSTVFLLSKAARYFYDADAIREDAEYGRRDWNGGVNFKGGDITKGHGDTSVTGGDPSAGRNARSVWTIPTQPTPFAHFATWPEALVRRMILAGTSEKGCCPECGAPWVRDVEKGELVASHPRGEYDWRSSAHGPGEIAAGDMSHYGFKPGRAYERKQMGWSPSCDCKPSGSDGLDHPGVWEFTYPPVPCTVLDPFAGSATTMLVARNHGRHSIGIELNEDYLRIAARRLQQLSLLTC